MSIIRKNNFEGLIENVFQTHCLLQENAAKAVNFNLTVRNWLVGWYIIEYEQNGDDRAQYGKRLIDEMAKKIEKKRNKRPYSNSFTLVPHFLSDLSANSIDSIS